MKRFIVSLSILVMIFGFGGTAIANPTTFTFDSLNPDDGAAEISSYMSGVYGGTVAVSAVGKPQAEGLGLLWNYFGDRYIESEPLGTLRHPEGHVIEMTFSGGINSVSFDWATLTDKFYADADGVNFFYSSEGIIKSGHVDYAFSSTVYTLLIHDSFIGEIGIDNLVVNKAPEPMSLLLLVLGLLGIGVARRKN